MGQYSSRIPFTNKNKLKILMIGLDGAGKTTLLYKLMLNEAVSIATLGYNVETLQHRHLNLTLWDLAGEEKIRSLWRPFYNKCSAIIFVVDSSDRNRIEEASNELYKILKEDELKNCNLLIYATKQDNENPIEIPELTDLLGLHEIRDRKWYVQPTKTLEGVGIYEGLDWLATKLIEDKKSKSFKSKFLKSKTSTTSGSAPNKSALPA